MDVFVPFGGLHAFTLVICVPLVAAPALLGRTSTPSGEAALRWALAALAVGYWLAYNTWWNWHGLDWRTGLPLQICDFNGSDGAVRTAHRPALGAGHAVFLDQRADAAGLRATRAHGRTGLADVLGILDRAHDHRRLCSLRRRRSRISSGLERPRPGFAVSGAYVALVVPVNSGSARTTALSAIRRP